MKKFASLTNGQMIVLGMGCCLLAVVTVSPFLLKANAEDYYASPYSATPYGVNGSMGERQLTDLMYLDFSRGQSYEAMKNRFGFPSLRDSTADYYRIGETASYVRVEYSADNRALGYSFVAP